MKVFTGIIVGALLGVGLLYVMVRWFHPDRDTES